MSVVGTGSANNLTIVLASGQQCIDMSQLHFPDAKCPLTSVLSQNCLVKLVASHHKSIITPLDVSGHITSLTAVCWDALIIYSFPTTLVGSRHLNRIVTVHLIVCDSTNNLSLDLVARD